MNWIGLAVAALVISQSASAQGIARVVDGRVVIDMLDASFAVPESFTRTTSRPRFGGCTETALRGAPRIHSHPDSLSALRDPNGYWDREFSAVVDSILPFPTLVAHLAEEPWGRSSLCTGSMHVRVYILEQAADILHQRATSVGARVARSFFGGAATAQTRDTALWRATRVEWRARYPGFEGIARVEIMTRRIEAKTLAVVFMYPWSDGPPLPGTSTFMLWQHFGRHVSSPALRGELLTILGSLRVGPTPYLPDGMRGVQCYRFDSRYIDSGEGMTDFVRLDTVAVTTQLPLTVVERFRIMGLTRFDGRVSDRAYAASSNCSSYAAGLM